MSAPRRVYVHGAARSWVAPRGGLFRAVEAWELGAAVLRRAAKDRAAQRVIMGNALYGGGNPARMAALAAGFSPDLPALTIDTQCCAGLDAVALAFSEIRAGEADWILAGGLESYSRAPIRSRRPSNVDEAPEPYARPPFAPDPAFDPEPDVAAREIAATQGYSLERLADYAASSHARALGASPSDEIAQIAGAPASQDPFTRALSRRTALRAGDRASTAIEADAAAALLLSSEPGPVEILAVASAAGDPRRFAEAAILAARRVLEKQGVAIQEIAIIEVMEAFAAQALYWREAMAAPAERVNLGGGALARGHPIGASGAVLAVRLHHELLRLPPGAFGLAAIPAVGGLGSAALFRRQEDDG